MSACCLKCKSNGVPMDYGYYGMLQCMVYYYYYGMFTTFSARDKQ